MKSQHNQKLLFSLQKDSDKLLIHELSNKPTIE